MTADIIFVIRTASLRGAAIEALRRELRGLIAPGRRLILHMAGVEQVDTRGAAVLLEVARRIQEVGGTLKLVGLEKKVSAFFELLRLPMAIDIHGTSSDAFAIPAAA